MQLTKLALNFQPVSTHRGFEHSLVEALKEVGLILGLYIPSQLVEHTCFVDVDQLDVWKGDIEICTIESPTSDFAGVTVSGDFRGCDLDNLRSVAAVIWVDIWMSCVSTFEDEEAWDELNRRAVVLQKAAQEGKLQTEEGRIQLWRQLRLKEE